MLNVDWIIILIIWIKVSNCHLEAIINCLLLSRQSNEHFHKNGFFFQDVIKYTILTVYQYCQNIVVFKLVKWSRDTEELKNVIFLQNLLKHVPCFPMWGGEGVNLDFWDRKPACYQLSHPCSLRYANLNWRILKFWYNCLNILCRF